ncbi:MAG: hypothetical protein ACTHJS_06125 [Xanthobacteraceae bacterium]
MTYSYWRTERLILDAVDRRVLRKATFSDRIVSGLGHIDLMVVAAFCAIGLLASLVAMLVMPGEIVQLFQQLA